MAGKVGKPLSKLVHPSLWGLLLLCDSCRPNEYLAHVGLIHPSCIVGMLTKKTLLGFRNSRASVKAHSLAFCTSISDVFSHHLTKKKKKINLAMTFPTRWYFHRATLYKHMCSYACVPERAMASADFMLASSVKADGRGSEALQL